MSDSEAESRARRAVRTHDSFERRSEGRYAVTATVFDADVEVGGRDGNAVFAVEVRVPMLDAVTDDRVAPVVEDGWFDTLSLRLEDVDGVLRGTDDVAVDVERLGDEAAVRVELADIDATRGADDAVAVAQYVEGTYVEGVIPGYDYTEPVTQLLRRATDAAGGTEGGTPL